jgi:hypothetical protein
MARNSNSLSKEAGTADAVSLILCNTLIAEPLTTSTWPVTPTVPGRKQAQLLAVSLILCNTLIAEPLTISTWPGTPTVLGSKQGQILAVSFIQ